MMHKLFKLLLVTAFFVPVLVKAKLKSKKFCNLAVARNLCVGGNLYLDGVNLAPLTALAGALGATGATLPALGNLVSGIVPFSSGLITLGAATAPFAAGLPLVGAAIGFGSSIPLTGVPATDELYHSAYSFDVPAAGTLHTLAVSANAVTLGTGLPAPIALTYTVYTSPAPVAGVDTPPTYTASALAATATLPATAAVVTNVAASGASALAIPVAAGTRVVIVVTPSAAIAVGVNVGLLALNAGVEFSPS